MWWNPPTGRVRTPLHEDEIRSVAVGYGEVGLAARLEIAIVRKREERPPNEPPI
jgi:hypothetical protein